jgi:hypothetical protein
MASAARVINMQDYRAVRETKRANEEIVTSINLDVNQGGRIVASSNRVDNSQALNVLVWCLSLSMDVLSRYFEDAPAIEGVH